MISAPRQQWRRLRALADRRAKRLELAALPIRVEPAGRAGAVSRLQIEHKRHSQTLWLPGPVAQVQSVIAAARLSEYGKINRIAGSIVQGFNAWPHLASAAGLDPVRCLFIGYGHDTYDAQLLANLGLQVRAEFLDVLDPDPADERWAALRRTPGIVDTVYRQMDARRIGEGLAGERYDLVAIIRGSIDLMPPQDYLAVITGCHAVTAARGLFIAPAISLQFTPRILSVIRRKFWFGEEVEVSRPTYKSQLGEFQLDRLGQYHFIDVAFAEDEVNFKQAIVEQMQRFAEIEPAFSELSDLLKAQDSPGWLEKLATYNGLAGPVLTLADLPGRAAVGGFDITRYPRSGDERWAFSARTTLVIRPTGTPAAG